MLFTVERVTKQIEITGICTAFEAHYDKDFFFGGENHDFWEFVYIIKGKAGVSADEKVYTLSKNEIIFHKPMEFHRIWSEDETNPQLFIMSFAVLGGSMEKFKNGVFRLTPEQNICLYQLIGFLRQLRDNYNENKTVNYFFPINNHNLRENMSLTEIQTVANLAEIFLLSLNNDQNIRLNTLDNKEVTTYKLAVQIMEDKICENISVLEIADKCMVSPSYLKNVFSKYAGIGIHKYFLKIKMNFASQLLKNGESVANVSDILFFSSQNYFSMVYKRETGNSPTEYKKKYR